MTLWLETHLSQPEQEIVYNVIFMNITRNTPFRCIVEHLIHKNVEYFGWLNNLNDFSRYSHFPKKENVYFSPIDDSNESYRKLDRFRRDENLELDGNWQPIVDSDGGRTFAISGSFRKWYFISFSRFWFDGHLWNSNVRRLLGKAATVKWTVRPAPTSFGY